MSALHIAVKDLQILFRDLGVCWFSSWDFR